MRAQRLPDALQSSHVKRYRVGLFDQAPRLADRVLPTTASPVSFGSARFAGACLVAADVLPTTSSWAARATANRMNVGLRRDPNADSGVCEEAGPRGGKRG
jgi:hypothetical protein